MNRNFRKRQKHNRDREGGHGVRDFKGEGGNMFKDLAIIIVYYYELRIKMVYYYNRYNCLNSVCCETI